MTAPAAQPSRESYAALQQKLAEAEAEAARLRHDLTEALEQQTATSEILRVIAASPTDVRPVLDAIAENAARLCDASDAHVLRVDGDRLAPAAAYGPLPLHFPSEGLPIGRGLVGGRAVTDRQTVHVHDMAAEPEAEFPESKHLQALEGFRAILAAPLLLEAVPLGVIVIRRAEARPFTDQQIALLETFADQAVIAIENARLFRELQDRHRDLAELQAQQAAERAIARLISGTVTDLQTVFDAVVQSAARLCEASGAVLQLVDGLNLRSVARDGTMRSPYDTSPTLRGLARPINREWASGRAVVDQEVLHIPDLLAAAETGLPHSRAFVQQHGHRTALCVPLLRDGVAMGVIGLARLEVRPFSERQIDLVKAFADQAVIAIENTRLFQELEARTRELARSVEELRALGDVGQAVSSTLDLETVLTTIVTRASELSGTDAGGIYEYDEATERFELRATHRLGEEVIRAGMAAPIRLGEGAMGESAVRRGPVQVPDIRAKGAYTFRLRGVLLRSGFRAILGVPLLREGWVVGGLVLLRKSAGAFSPDVIDLMQTFASQSALAIQNARLFKEIEIKSRELELASQHKSEFLANMSHELRTPLNAIIGFSEVLLERMFGELNERQEEYLRDVLTSGQHLLSLINDILDLSKVEAGRMELELGSFSLREALENGLTIVKERASRHGITLGLGIDDDLDQIEADERKVKQMVFNLLSNAVKFTPDGGRVEVTARRIDEEVRVAVSDTGIGIALEDLEHVFDEFRQVGPGTARAEGTGLGLALAKKLVELHGGRIWAESRVGVGSTFTFALPRRRPEGSGAEAGSSAVAAQ